MLDTFDGIMAFAEAISQRVAEVGRIKAEQRKAKRAARYQIRKRLGLIKPRPTKAEKDAAEAAKRREWLEGEERVARERATSCMCFLGRAPCTFCENYNPDEHNNP
jgi:DNA invertase Pin-like site-specific DNA recombinase